MTQALNFLFLIGQRRRNKIAELEAKLNNEKPETANRTGSHCSASPAHPLISSGCSPEPPLPTPELSPLTNQQLDTPNNRDELGDSDQHGFEVWEQENNTLINGDRPHEPVGDSVACSVDFGSIINSEMLACTSDIQSLTPDRSCMDQGS